MFTKEYEAMNSRESMTLKQWWLVAGLAGIVIGALILSWGIGRLFVGDASTAVLAVASTALLMCLVSMACIVRLLQRLPDSDDDCINYGRHTFGLTFLLLLFGLCNAVLTSTLALRGGLTISAASLVDASDPAHAQRADEQLLEAVKAEKQAEKYLHSKERELRRATDTMLVICSTPTSEKCAPARDTAMSLEDAVAAAETEYKDAHALRWQKQSDCEDARWKSRRALFFLLSMSTSTALFGASFFVVNTIRSKRPKPRKDQSGSGDPGAGNTNGSAVSSASATGGTTPHAEPSGTSASVGDGSMSEPDPFDVHEFWSGAFFRGGEAVLFTFAVFWYLWTSNRERDVIWLPVVALFIGMFVKTGEAIIFRLGMRVLSAVEALFPGGQADASTRHPPRTDGNPQQPLPPHATPNVTRTAQAATGSVA